MSPRTISLVLAATVLALLAARAAAAAPRSAARASAHRLNVVFIVSDDERVQGNAVMRHVQRLLAEHGVTFTQLPRHDLGVRALAGEHPHGAYSPPHRRHSTTSGRTAIPPSTRSSNLAVWLHRRRLRDRARRQVPERLHALRPPRRAAGLGRLAGDRQRPEERYYDYTLNENGRLVHYGNKPTDYSTTVLTQKAVAFLRHAHKPFFLYFAPVAPHLPAIPAPQDIGKLDNLPHSGTPRQRVDHRRQALARLPRPGAHPRRP